MLSFLDCHNKSSHIHFCIYSYWISHSIFLIILFLEHISTTMLCTHDFFGSLILVLTFRIITTSFIHSPLLHSPKTRLLYTWYKSSKELNLVLKLSVITYLKLYPTVSYETLVCKKKSKKRIEPYQWRNHKLLSIESKLLLSYK